MADFVELFRGAAPYIRAHRGRTFVVQVGGDAIAADGFTDLIHDLALLHSLGIKLVIVFGVRAQVDRLLDEKQIRSDYHGTLRITDETAISSVTQAVGEVKARIEAALSMGLPDSVMARAGIKVASGNYLTGRPYGVIDGVDFKLTGRVRSVEHPIIRERLEAGEVVVIPPLGYAATGEVFNLSSIEVAAEVAMGLKADKLILLTRPAELAGDETPPIRELTCDEARTALAGGVDHYLDDSPASALALGIQACEAGVGRVHFIDQGIDGGLLQELFTRDGVGTLLSNTPFDTVRRALAEDVGGIEQLTAPLARQGILLRRSIEQITADIEHYHVLIRDDTVIACAALYPWGDGLMEMAGMAVHPDYQNRTMGDLLFQYLEVLALKQGATGLFLLTTQTSHWFIERGFVETGLEVLPEERRARYDEQRKPKVLLKKLKR